MKKELWMGKWKYQALLFFGQWSMLYIGATEVARGRGRWRKWRGAAAFQLFAPMHMGCFLLYHLYPFSDFFLSKLIASLLVGSNRRHSFCLVLHGNDI